MKKIVFFSLVKRFEETPGIINNNDTYHILGYEYIIQANITRPSMALEMPKLLQLHFQNAQLVNLLVD